MYILQLNVYVPITKITANILSCSLLILFCNYTYWMKNLSCNKVNQLGGQHTTSVWQIQSQGSGSSLVSLALCTSSPT